MSTIKNKVLTCFVNVDSLVNISWSLHNSALLLDTLSWHRRGEGQIKEGVVIIKEKNDTTLLYFEIRVRRAYCEILLSSIAFYV